VAIAIVTAAVDGDDNDAVVGEVVVVVLGIAHVVVEPVSSRQV